MLWMITMKKELGYLVKINSFGAIFTIMIISSIIFMGIYGLATCKYEIVIFHDNKDG